MIYLFDVDGTLTEPRKPIESGMKKWVMDLALKGRPKKIDDPFIQVYTVTGSPKEVYQTQIPDDLRKVLAGEFWCSGNHFRIGNRYTKRQFDMPSTLLDTMYRLWDRSLYPDKKGSFIEIRPGAIYYAVCGVDADEEERENYFRWNLRAWEREAHHNLLMDMFPTLTVVTGGKVSIDILNKGKDKSQIIEHLPQAPITFVGDKTMVGGNDYSLAQAVESLGGRVVTVNSPKDTLKFLEEEWTRI